MTITSTEAPVEVVAHTLRTRVRDLLEMEYLRLRTIDRPALLERVNGAAEGTDLDLVRGELAVVDERIAAVHDYLATLLDPHLGFGPSLDCCVLLDTGDGPPQWFLLAALPVEDEQVIAADSSLGRALTGARPGQTFRYLTPAGPRLARLLDVQPSDLR